LLSGAVRQTEGDDMDPRRARLQLRIVRVAMQVAEPAERETMVPPAIEILDKVAYEIGARPDPALTALLANVRSEVEGTSD
jgi:hypothetical protein